MFAVVILSATLTGQCGPSGCPAPRYAPSYAIQAAPAYRVIPSVAPAAPQGPSYVIKTYRIKSDGLIFDVRGYYVPESNTIFWEPGDPFNRRSRAEAVAERARTTSRPAGTDKIPTAVAERVKAAPDKGTVLTDKPTAVAGDHEIAKVDGIQNYGLAPERLRQNSTYTASTDEARQFVIEARHPAQAEPGKLHVTVIGTTDSRAPVVNDINTHPALAGMRDHLLVQDYAPGDWAIDPSLGFQGDGAPTIIVQAAKGPSDPRGGRVIYRANDYSKGPTGLAEAIRKAEPHYKPDADPGPASPSGGDFNLARFVDENQAFLLGVVCVVGFLVLAPNRKVG